MKNEKKIRKYGIRVLDSLAVAVLAVLLAVSGLLDAPGGWLEDALYQRGDDRTVGLPLWESTPTP